jgi:hypothetical protein
MTERELKLLLDANAAKKVHVLYALMSQGYMIVVDGQPLKTTKLPDEAEKVNAPDLLIALTKPVD